MITALLRFRNTLAASVILCIAFNSNAQVNSHDTSLVSTQINIYHSDLKNATIIGTQNNYYGLDSQQRREIEQLKAEIAVNNAKMADYSFQSEQDKRYIDSVFLIVREIRTIQRKYEALKHLNDSILNSKRGDEIIHQQLLKQYNQKLADQWGDFWTQNPEFNPNSNVSAVTFMEKANNESYSNRYRTGSAYTPTFSACNLCIRDHPGEWVGITKNGVAYNFNSPEFETLTAHIPGHGPVSLTRLREMYAAYWNLINNKYYEVEKPYEEYLAAKYKDSSYIKSKPKTAEQPKTQEPEQRLPVQTVYEENPGNTMSKKQAANLTVKNTYGMRITVYITNQSDLSQQYVTAMDANQSFSISHFSPGYYNIMIFDGLENGNKKLASKNFTLQPGSNYISTP